MQNVSNNSLRRVYTKVQASNINLYLQTFVPD